MATMKTIITINKNDDSMIVVTDWLLVLILTLMPPFDAFRGATHIHAAECAQHRLWKGW